MKLKSILEDIEILKPRRSSEERQKNYTVVLQKQIQQYIKNGCEGDLDLRDAPIEKLPENLKKVGGNLILSRSKIKTLPNDLHVDKCLSLESTEIKKLPNNLTVDGSVWACDSKIEELGKNTKISNHLDLSYSAIKKIPEDIEIGTDDRYYYLYLGGTPISYSCSIADLRRTLPNIKSKIFF